MRVLIAIPVFNEGATVKGVLRAVQRFVPPEADVLVIDDGSTDSSAQALAELSGITVLTHEKNWGYGASLSHAFQFAIERGHEVVVTMDCDEQHEPHLIPSVLAALDGADIVSGSRHLTASFRGQDAPADRLRINQEMTKRINESTGYGITDAFCGFKAYRTAALRKLELDEPSYGMPLQLWIQAAKHRLRVKEMPVGLIYKNLDRRFGNGLDDPRERRQYYLDIINKETRRWQARSSS